MSDTMIDPAQKPSPKRRGMKIALAVSVALNLAVLGVVGGLALHGGPDGPGGMGVRDLGFGPFDEVLTPDDRANLRQSLVQKVGTLKSSRQQMMADGAAILTGLRADPYDAVALAAAMDAQAAHMTERLKLGNSVIRDYLVALPPQARHEIADRLEQRMRHGRGDTGDTPPKN